MTLSTIERNQIAYQLLLNMWSDIKVSQLYGSFRGLCDEANISFEDGERLKAILFADLENFNTTSISSGTREDDICELAWKVAIRFIYHKGIHLSDRTRREVGNEAAKYGISTDKAMEFSGMLAQEVHSVIFRQ